MLLRFFHLLPGELLTFLALVGFGALALVVAITVHEFSHAMVATGLGDTTAKRQGRLSLNPMVHLDPVGSAMILLAGFGWGKPVPVNPNNLSHGAMGGPLVAAAGPLSNLTLAFLLAAPIKLGVLNFPDLGEVGVVDLVSSGSVLGLVSLLFAQMILINFLLAVFNLIPLSPLDGSRILEGFIPRGNSATYARIQQYGPVILIAVIMLDYMSSFSILGTFLWPVVNVLRSIAVG
jgi:Zn-dependent protease